MKYRVYSWFTILNKTASKKCYNSNFQKEVNKMKNKIWLSLSLVLVFSNIAFSQTARKTITNEDLEKYKQARLKAEAEYKEKYKELGMPSPEELEKQREEAKRRNEQTLANSGVYEQIAANDFQGRANFLRNQIYSINAQIDYLNNQIAGLPVRNNPVMVAPNIGYGVGYVPYGNRQSQVRQQQNTNVGSSVQAARNAAAAMPNPHAGTSLSATGVKSVIGNQPTYRRGNRGYYGYYPIIVNNNNNNVQRDELISRLQYLGQVRAGLFAEWNILVEEARRAGVRINF